MGAVADAVGDFVGDAFDVIGDAVEGIVDVVGDVAQFVGNVVEGTLENAWGMVHGALTLDWTEFRDSAMGVLNTAVAAVAIVVGAITGNVALVAAGVVMLDAQYNEGRLLARTIELVGKVETAVFNSHVIEENAYIIQAVITVGATLYAGFMAGPIVMEFLGEATGIAALLKEWGTVINAVQVGMGAYQVYSAVELIIASQEYWKAKLAEYEAAIKAWIAQLEAAKNQWFDMYTNPDMINRIQAGGDLFIMGAGHDLWSVTSVAEPRYALGLVDRSDNEMDKLMNNRIYAQAAGSDGFKIN